MRLSAYQPLVLAHAPTEANSVQYIGIALIVFMDSGVLRDPLLFRTTFLINSPEIIRHYPRLAFIFACSPYILWAGGIVFSFLYSITFGFISLGVVFVLWIALSPTPDR